MGHILVLAAFTFAAVTASSIPDRPTTLPLTLPILQERSEQPITCLTGIKRSPEPINSKRGIEKNCGRSQRDVTRAFASCAAKAQKGREAALKGGELMKTLFKRDDDATRKRVADHFEQIASQCGAKENSGVSVNCGQCEQGIAGKAYKGSGPITLCSVALADTQSTTQCGGQDLDDVLLHEMSHVLGSTDDLGYGLEACKQLDAQRSLQNADSFTKFARAATLNCSVGGPSGPGSDGPGSGGPGGDGDDGGPSSPPGPSNPNNPNNPGRPGRPGSGGPGSGGPGKPGKPGRPGRPGGGDGGDGDDGPLSPPGTGRPGKPGKPGRPGSGGPGTGGPEGPGTGGPGGDGGDGSLFPPGTGGPGGDGGPSSPPFDDGNGIDGGDGGPFPPFNGGNGIDGGNGGDGNNPFTFPPTTGGPGGNLGPGGVQPPLSPFDGGNGIDGGGGDGGFFSSSGNFPPQSAPPPGGISAFNAPTAPQVLPIQDYDRVEIS